MRFAILGSRGFPSTYGGYETLVRHLAPHLVLAGHDVTVYCRAREGSSRIWMNDQVRCIATPGLESKSLPTLTFGLSSTLDASLRHYDAALVLNIANGFWFPALRLSRTPFAVNTDGIEWERGKWSRLGRAKYSGRRPDRSCEACADIDLRLACDRRDLAGPVWARLHLHPLRRSRSLKFRKRQARSAGLDREPYVLVVARLVPENNVELTLDALDLLGTEAPRAVIVGSANGESPIEARLSERSDDRRLLWLGHVDDQELLSQLWANCAVYVHGHSVGGTNPSLLEALALGAPTLALDTPFNAEVLPLAEHLFPSDAPALAARIRAVVDSRALQREMADRGRAVIRERYDWDAVCDAYTEVLTSLGERRAPVIGPHFAAAPQDAVSSVRPERRFRSSPEPDPCVASTPLAVSGHSAAKKP